MIAKIYLSKARYDRFLAESQVLCEYYPNKELIGERLLDVPVIVDKFLGDRDGYFSDTSGMIYRI